MAKLIVALVLTAVLAVPAFAQENKFEPWVCQTAKRVELYSGYGFDRIANFYAGLMQTVVDKYFGGVYPDCVYTVISPPGSE